MKLSTLINEIRESDPSADDAHVARLVIEEALASPDPANLLFAPVHAFVISQARTKVRQQEQKAAKWSRPEPAPVPVTHTPVATDAAAQELEAPEYIRPGSDEDPAIAARRALLRERVHIPGQGYIPWGSLTVEDHAAKIEFLKYRISGYEATISRHRDAIDVLTRTGKETLFEVFESETGEDSEAA